MCYRNNTLLSTIVNVQAEVLEKNTFTGAQQVKGEVPKERQVIFTYTPRIALHPEKINKSDFSTVQ